jgi:K+-sensing histidine kinase KdpD
VRRQWLYVSVAFAAIAGATVLLTHTSAVNTTTVALVYLLIILFLGTVAELWTAVVASLGAMLCFNFFFLPPVGTFTIAEGQNWVALVAFLAVSVVASQLSAAARARAGEIQRAKLLSALLASLSHDLRTPLTAIRTAVGNLDSGGLSADQRRDQARVASVEIERLTRVFDEILDMARIDAGGVQPQRRWVTPAEIVDAAAAHASAALAGSELRVETDDDTAAEIDPRLTASALAHVLENAARYAQAGYIQVAGWTDESGLRIDVRDEGPGLQPSEFERIFEPFYRGDRDRLRVAGTGMGLSITRGLLAAEGGRVWATNLNPRGACFSIAIPARTRPSAVEPS